MIRFKTAAGTTLWFGNTRVVLPANTTLDFDVSSLDALAETFASHPPTFALNKDRLTHKEDGETVRYGLGGARVREED